MRCDMRLIDADALIKAWCKKHNIKEGDCGAVFTGYSEIPRLIDEQPTIDAVEVVRCKDCKRRQEDTIFHKLYCDGREVVADGYCWKGEQDD